MSKKILVSLAITVIIAIAILLMMKISVKAPIQSAKIEENGQKPISGSGEYVLNQTESILKAHGNKPLVPGYTDNSMANFKEGYVTLTDGKISGSFKVDMNSIAIESTSRKSGESMLERHLKSPDFFNVEKYPESGFEIKSTEKTDEDDLYMVTGDLTLKEMTQSISFPTVIYMKNNHFHIVVQLVYMVILFQHLI